MLQGKFKGSQFIYDEANVKFIINALSHAPFVYRVDIADSFKEECVKNASEYFFLGEGIRLPRERDLLAHVLKLIPSGFKPRGNVTQFFFSFVFTCISLFG